MKHLLLLFSVLLLSLQPAAFAATHETTATPDSVSLFAYATRGDDGRSGLRFAWSMDGKHWFEIGQNYGYLRCDYSRWGSQKKMLDPNLKQLPGGEWRIRSGQIKRPDLLGSPAISPYDSRF